MVHHTPQLSSNLFAPRNPDLHISRSRPSSPPQPSLVRRLQFRLFILLSSCCYSRTPFSALIPIHVVLIRALFYEDDSPRDKNFLPSEIMNDGSICYALPIWRHHSSTICYVSLDRSVIPFSSKMTVSFDSPGAPSSFSHLL